MGRRARTASVAIAILVGVLELNRAAAQAPPAPDEQPVDPYAPQAPEEPASQPENQPGQDPGPGPDTSAADDDIDEQVAQVLYRRGLQLYRSGAAADAKTLFVESLERSPRGRSAGDALRMLRAANRRLGITNQDDGRPAARSQEDVLDPYGGATPPPAADESPLDPYGATPTPPPPVDEPPVEDEPEVAPGSTLGRRAVMAWSGAVGLVVGMAVAGPENDSGELSDGAAVAGLLGAAGGVGLSYWLTRRAPLTAGQSAAISSFATLGAASAGLLGDATTGTDSVANDVWKYVAAGGVVGLGGGVLYARAANPSVEDMAMTNSLALLGAAAGLTIAAGMEPPESEAFSLNALFGASAGLAAGLLLSPRVDISLRRTLYVDLGALAGGAAAWGLLYPLISDDASHNDEQVVGWVSTATLAGGAVAAWYFTRGMDAPTDRLSRRRGPPAPPALAQREADGSWQIGAPFVRPLVNPTLGGSGGIGVDLVSGRF
jgi:hypothetical protein